MSIAAALIMAYGTVASGGGSNLTRTDYAMQSFPGRGDDTTAQSTTAYALPANALVIVIQAGVGANNESRENAVNYTCTASDAGVNATQATIGNTGTPSDWSYGHKIYAFTTTTAVSCSFSLHGDAAAGIEYYVCAVMAFTGDNLLTPYAGFVSAYDSDGTGTVTLTLTAAPASGDQTITVMNGDNDSAPTSVTFGSGFTQIGFTTSDNEGQFAYGVRSSSTSTSVPWTNIGVGGTTDGAFVSAFVVKSS